MIIFANADGSIAAFSPSRITQGSVDANKIVLVGPFSNSIVTIAFTLPNGIVLGPNLAELPEEYTMTELNDGEAVHTGLYAYSYTMNKSLTSMSGTLGIQFFISTNRGTAENPTYTDTLATNMVNVTVYNGSRYIPPLEVPSSSDELTELLASIESALKNAIQIDSDGNAQYIYSDVDIKKKTGGDSTEGEGTEGEGTGGNLGVEGNLDVGGYSNLGLTAKVVNADGDATITLDGATGGIDVKGDVKAKSITLPAAGKEAIEIVNNGEYLRIDSSIYLDGDVKADGNLTVADNAEIGGNLTVKGKTFSQSQESLIVNDNIIVTNSSGASFSTSGLVIRIPENENGDNAYGILYDPFKDAVMVGIGKFNPDTYEFAFTPGQALPLAARDGFDSTQNDVVPIWNSEKNAFIPTIAKVKTVADLGGSQYKCFEIATDVVGATSTRIAGHKIETNSVWANGIYLGGSKVATESYVTGQLGGLEEFLRKVNEGGLV
jgi:cytoskeletal protein CcmA (bactofilin family)